jgi:Spy/CpxP family protein refolding chaperone
MNNCGRMKDDLFKSTFKCVFAIRWIPKSTKERPQMKKHLMMAALTLALAIPGATWANKHDMSPAEREKKLDKMATELKLTQDQKNKVRTIKEEKYNKVQAAVQEAHQKIREVLSPDQQVKFDKMIQEKD